MSNTIKTTINELEGGMEMGLFMKEINAAMEKVKAMEGVSDAERAEYMEEIISAMKVGITESVVPNKVENKPYLEVLNNKDYISMTHVEVGEEVTISNQPTGVGRYLRHAVTAKGSLVPFSKGVLSSLPINYFAPHTKSFISVTFAEKSELDRISELGSNLYIQYKDDSVEVYLPKKSKGAVVYVASSTGDIVDSNELKHFNKYSILSYSASGVKKASALFIENSNGIVEKMLEECSLGAYKKFKDDVAKLGTTEIDKSFISVLKGAVRFGQLYTASNNLGPINSFFILDGNFGRESKVHDGMSFTSDVYFARVMSEYVSNKLGYPVKIKPAAVRGLILQIRPGMTKCSTVIVSERAMKAIIQSYGGVEKFARHGVVTDVPDVIFDGNCVKLNWEFDKVLNFELLDIGRKTGAATSIQALAKPLFTGDVKQWVNVVKDLCKESIDADIKNMIEGRVLTPEEFENGFVHDKCMMINKDQFLSNKVLRDTRIDNALKGASNAVKKLKFECEGLTGTLSDDFADVFGGAVIRYGELYSPFYAKLIHESIQQYNDTGKWDNELVKRDEETNEFYVEVAMIKYPSVGLTEVYVARAIGIRTIVKRCLKAFGKQSVVEEYYRSLDAAHIVLPAMEILMNKLAGLDYDFDGATLIAEPSLIEMFKKLPDEVVVIK